MQGKSANFWNPILHFALKVGFFERSNLMRNNFISSWEEEERQEEKVMELSYEITLHLHNVISIANPVIYSAGQILYVCLSNSHYTGKLPLISSAALRP